MIHTTKIAIIRPESQELSLITSMLSRQSLEVLVVDDVEALQLEMDIKKIPIEAVVMGLRLASGMGAMGACIKIRASKGLMSLPILILSPNRDLPVIESLYESGASCVIVPPFNSDLISGQLMALAGLNASFKEELHSQLNSQVLRSALIGALNSIREAVILLDSDRNPVYLNKSARVLLGVSDNASSQEVSEVSEQFASLIQEREPALASTQLLATAVFPPRTTSQTLTRLDQRSFQGEVRICPIAGEGATLAGYSLAFRDIGETEHLFGSLLQSQRTRSLCLLALAGCLRYLRSVFGQIPVAPIAKLEEILRSEKKACEMNPTLLSLLEVLDLIISPGIEFKVKNKKDWRVAVSEPDLFDLLGHLILHAVEYAGVSGTITVQADMSDSPLDINVVIVSEVKKFSFSGADAQPKSGFYTPMELFRSFLLGEGMSFPAESEKSTKLLYGLQAAQEIASRYKRKIEYKSKPNQFKVRFKLPVAGE
ncbi:MAG: hypothetical protein DCC75_05790 [Proteobacteria bacterium]|nr:MAG: hypothetical protein DCC75_05790 [Pseudomonadota bacterium]